MRLLLCSENQTFNFGKKIASFLCGGEMILLNGDMGAGKTALTKGIAAGLDITDGISSPTFTLLNIYKGRLTLYHYDMFRIESVLEVEESGLTEYFGKKSGVCVIEWADKLSFDYSDTAIRITMKYVDENTREAIICGMIEHGSELV